MGGGQSALWTDPPYVASEHPHTCVWRCSRARPPAGRPSIFTQQLSKALHSCGRWHRSRARPPSRGTTTLRRHLVKYPSSRSTTAAWLCAHGAACTLTERRSPSLQSTMVQHTTTIGLRRFMARAIPDGGSEASPVSPRRLGVRLPDDVPGCARRILRTIIPYYLSSTHGWCNTDEAVL